VGGLGRTRAVGSPAVGTRAVGNRAVGTRAAGSRELGTPVAGSRELGTPVAGIPKLGIPAGGSRAVFRPVHRAGTSGVPMAADQASRAGGRPGRGVGRSPANAPEGVAHGPILSRRGGFLNVPQLGTRSVCTMAELKDRLRSDLTEAMKTQDKLRTATLRMLLAAIQTEEVSGKQARDLSDDEVLKVLARESKKRSESAEIYTQNGRGELAAEEHAEARIIDEYLPTPLTEAEVADVADTAIAQVAEQIGERPSKKQMGMVMKAATAIAAGKADGARLSEAVKDRL